MKWRRRCWWPESSFMRRFQEKYACTTLHIVQTFFKLFKLFSNCSNFFQIVQEDYNLFKYKLYKKITNCSRNFEIVQEIFKLFKKLPNCSRNFQIVQENLKLFKKKTNYSRNFLIAEENNKLFKKITNKIIKTSLGSECHLISLDKLNFFSLYNL